MHESVEKEQVVSIVMQLLQRADLAFDRDTHVARREIQRALELLLDNAVKTPIQPSHVHCRIHGLAPWQERRLIDHIHTHLETSIRVEDMANVTRLSTSYFFRAFKLSFSTSPQAYVLTLRLARACELLLGGDEQMSQIAVACGFADQAHFSRTFRREMGCAPGVWRRERRRPLHRIDQRATSCCTVPSGQRLP